MAIFFGHAAEKASHFQIKLTILHRFDLRLTELTTGYFVMRRLADELACLEGAHIRGLDHPGLHNLIGA